MCDFVSPSPSAIFLPPSKVDTLYDLLWFVAVNDFMLKFLAVILKIGLVFTPGQLVPYQKRVSDRADQASSL